ncbi:MULTISPECIES: YdcF family protein [unclassified Lentilitoribacter]|jgi:uncharacterized SAM-binding protein YcdF (DUF218 family)|uniref:YdcF family protein n=1 Tax=unclassified Lentilitoribacter TaxID=2647570 RepID=UPI0013A6DF05|nr:YdcF family protein [Lentilitoribacter sp. Alg239-R112]
MLNVPEPKVLDAAFSVWQYHCLEEIIPLDPSGFDLIVGLGSYDTRVAEKCADLYHAGLGPKIVFTGARGNFTKDIFDVTEAAAFAKTAIKNGVPNEDVLLEEQAMNTGENILNVKEMFPECTSAIFVAKPLMLRRCRATLDQIWPDLSSVVTAPNIHMISQPTDKVDIQKVIHEIVGNYWRIRTYPQRGFQSEQDFDENADKAFQTLIDQGYTKHLPDDWENALQDLETELVN